MEVIVFTSDRYVSLLDKFAYLFNKHWSPDQKVNILGFKPPETKLPDNFKFISAGKQEDFPPKSVVEPFRPILESLDTDIFVLMLEDAFLIDTVDQDLLSKGATLLREDKASKIELFLGADYQYRSSLPFNDDFNVFPQDMNYRYTAAQSLIRKDYYLKYFDQPNMWALEINNIPRAKNDGHTLLVSKSKPIAPWINSVVKGGYNTKHHNKMLASKSGRHFGWNKFQRLNDEEYEIFTSLKDWKAG